MHVEEMLDDEVTALAGARYARKDASIGGHVVTHITQQSGDRGPRGGKFVSPGSSPSRGGEIPLRSYETPRSEGAVNDRLHRPRVLYGIS